MKKRIVVLSMIAVVAGAMFISGCKKNDSNAQGRLQGKWIFLQIDEVFHPNVDQSIPFTQSFDGTSYLQFNGDSTFSAIIDLPYSGNWNVSGTTLTLTDPIDSSVNVLTIQKLSSQLLDLYTTQQSDSGSVESTWHLKKSGS